MSTTHDDATRPDLSTREGWQELADALLDATVPFASPGGALISLPGPASASGRWSDGLEGFARTFLLAAFRVSGARGGDPNGLLERYGRGLAAGVNPDDPERWPTVLERRQAVVEAASIAIGLGETRPWLWDRLDPAVQQHVVDWLAGVVGTSGYTNNWLWFQNVIEAFLASVGGPWLQDDLDRNDQQAEELYIGDGWYSDGAGPSGVRQSFDWYAGWAWHVYPLLRARIRGVDLEARHRERLTAYLDQARHLIGTGGAPLFQGRSLAYRFAVVAPFWAGAIANATPLASGETRDLASRTVNHFLDAGSIDQRGLLPIGWHRTFHGIRQLYTGSASPYWASKGLLGLLLPAEHNEWRAAPAASPPTTSVEIAPIAAPGWIAVGTPGDGVVRVVNHGSDGMRHLTGGPNADNPFYQRLAYSNLTSPDLSPGAIAAPIDSHVALLDGRGVPSHRDAIQRVYVDGRVAVSRSRVHWLDLPSDDRAVGYAGWAGQRRGPIVTVASVVHGAHELRLAWWSPRNDNPRPPALADWVAPWSDDPGPWRFRIGGWAIADESEPEATGQGARREDGLSSTVVDVRGLDVAGVVRRDGANPIARFSATPWVESAGPVPAGRVIAALVILSGEEITMLDDLPSITPDHDSIRISWKDGTIDLVPTGGEVVS
ncbi:DUF2264 domain-containing protein [Agromyces sp. LHK192]|uniref:DUF2264 domain-containing protein n=1 Tax=Agromyces sp. LHK192 TaxID=2498704 RepID=UPI001F0BFFAC|nr:DUF2264 domain-containing protein [Agromyces sp. LHK192]